MKNCPLKNQVLKQTKSTTCAFVLSECCISGLRLLASLCQDLDENYLYKGSEMSNSELSDNSTTDGLKY